MPQVLQRDELAVWCERWLGAKPTHMLFEVAHLSVVAGLRLTDGREVVVKARPPADRIRGVSTSNAIYGQQVSHVRSHSPDPPPWVC